MIFDSDQSAALLTLLGQTPYVGLTRSAMLGLLNTPSSIANPAPQGVVPVPFTLAAILTACSTATRPGLGGYLAAAAPLIIAQDGPHIADGLDGLVVLGAITADDATAIKAVLAATQPNPAWPAMVSGPSPFQALFPGIPFKHADATITVGAATFDMLTEVLG